MLTMDDEKIMKNCISVSCLFLIIFYLKVSMVAS